MKGNKQLDSIAHQIAAKDFKAAKALKTVSHSLSKIPDQVLLEGLLFGISELRKLQEKYKVRDLMKGVQNQTLPHDLQTLLVTVTSYDVECHSRFGKDWKD